ncbi:fatty acyl-AMP ligase [Streptomyces sp. A5-4]|uniref:fatty acyl-AMP ligase n=1 Tax=Streptomyces sp. A5-4 TaxID=3384771 RepID=UPI003DA87D07
MTTTESFTRRVLDSAEKKGDAEAFVFLQDDGAALTPERLSYTGLDAHAKDLASWLQDRGLRGRQVLLLYPSGLSFVSAFVGCLYAGAVAVPGPLPSDRDRHFARLSRIVGDARVGAVLTTAEHAPAVQAWLTAAGLSDVVCLATDSGPVGDASSWRDPGTDVDDLAFLQYTSGSTSEPKGVMVSHGNLMANEAAIQRALGSTQDSCLGSWLPMYHDMGLIGHVLHPLWLGGRAALMAPESFLRRPVQWLRMIGDHGVTHGGGPNFAYDMCVRRVRDAELAGLDLSGWQQACNGAEPIRAETVAAFTERFAPVGFRPETFFPCYGMAETTLLVSGTPLGREPVRCTVDTAALEDGRLTEPADERTGRTLVSSGVVRAEDFDVRIVHPLSRRVMGEHRVGEIWVRGPSVSRGYWERPVETEETFQARTAEEEAAGEGGEGHWLRTGDLGALGDGQLYVTGRLKEMVLVNGRNIYPHDVEAAVRKIDPALGTGAAFAVAPPGDGRDRLVVVLELRGRTEDLDHQGLVERVQAAIRDEFEVPAGNVLLVSPGTVRRTTSGKIQRMLMRKLFLAGSLDPVRSVVEPSVAALTGREAELQPVS